MDYVIIVAGGKGLRMGSDIPKQFLPIGGRPVLMRTIERFREYSSQLRIILVLPKAQQDYWRQLCQQYTFPLPQQGEDGLYRLADGGETRFHSVQHGLALIPDDAEGVVGVHDGVRPFPSVEVIRNCYETARQQGAAIPVIPVVETLRHVSSLTSPLSSLPSQHSPLTSHGSPLASQHSPLTSHDSPLPSQHSPLTSHVSPLTSQHSPLTSHVSLLTSETVPRAEYRLVQTPQCFDIRLLKAANRQPYNDNFTDDASVVEAYGHAITLVDGNRENIKLTTPYDLKIAEVLI